MPEYSLLRRYSRISISWFYHTKWRSKLGTASRKERLKGTASLQGSNTNLPGPNFNVQNLIAFFNRQGLDEADLVALSVCDIQTETLSPKRGQFTRSNFESDILRTFDKSLFENTW